MVRGRRSSATYLVRGGFTTGGDYKSAVPGPGRRSSVSEMLGAFLHSSRGEGLPPGVAGQAPHPRGLALYWGPDSYRLPKNKI